MGAAGTVPHNFYTFHFLAYEQGSRVTFFYRAEFAFLFLQVHSSSSRPLRSSTARQLRNLEVIARAVIEICPIVSLRGRYPGAKVGERARSRARERTASGIISARESPSRDQVTRSKSLSLSLPLQIILYFFLR